MLGATAAGHLPLAGGGPASSCPAVRVRRTAYRVVCAPEYIRSPCCSDVNRAKLVGEGLVGDDGRPDGPGGQNAPRSGPRPVRSRSRGVPGHPVRRAALRPPALQAARAARALGRGARRGRVRTDRAETAVLRGVRPVPVRPGHPRRRLPQSQRMDARPGARRPAARPGVAARRRPDQGFLRRAGLRRPHLRARRRRLRLGQLPAGRRGLRTVPGRAAQPRPARPARRAALGARGDRRLRRRPRPHHPVRPVGGRHQRRRPARLAAHRRPDPARGAAERRARDLRPRQGTADGAPDGRPAEDPRHRRGLRRRRPRTAAAHPGRGRPALQPGARRAGVRRRRRRRPRAPRPVEGPGRGCRRPGRGPADGLDPGRVPAVAGARRTGGARRPARPRRPRRGHGPLPLRARGPARLPRPAPRGGRRRDRRSDGHRPPAARPAAPPRRRPSRHQPPLRVRLALPAPRTPCLPRPGTGLRVRLRRHPRVAEARRAGRPARAVRRDAQGMGAVRDERGPRLGGVGRLASGADLRRRCRAYRIRSTGRGSRPVVGRAPHPAAPPRRRPPRPRRRTGLRHASSAPLGRRPAPLIRERRDRGRGAVVARPGPADIGGRAGRGRSGRFGGLRGLGGHRGPRRSWPPGAG
ncbi:hypothetical protein SGPA1_10782 [Streptomyces misionensis JCM 4497]